jgi:serine/threonine protein kinase
MGSRDQIMKGGSRDPIIGRNIDGYQIERLLGHGGMARVYRGYDHLLKRYVAVKVIDPRMEGDPVYAQRFMQEARAVAQLRHANIVNVYRFGDVDGLYYMAMDYIDGCDLRWLLQDYRHDGELIPHVAAVDIIAQIASALDYAHAQGVIHRDVKPSNIMIDATGAAILTDFGLALVASEGTQGQIFGSPYYIAPEQAMSSRNVVPQSDLYALGVILYEMLTGRVPYADGTAIQIAMAHMAEPLPPAQQINPHLHPAFLPVLETALEKEPDQRFPNGAKLVAALRAAAKKAKADSPDTSRLGPRSTQSETRPIRSEMIAQSAKHRPDAAGTGLRVSRVDVPQKVSKFRELNPLTPAPGAGSVDAGTARIVLKGEGGKKSRQRRASGRLRRVLLGAIVLALGILAVLMLMRQGQTDDTLAVAADGATAAAEATGEPTLMVEGIISAVEGSTLVIFDTRFVLDSDHPLLAEFEPGAEVRITGRFEMTDGIIRIDEIHTATINGLEYTPASEPAS